MLNRKILTVLIVCFGVVSSIYLFERRPTETTQKNTGDTAQIENLDVGRPNNLGNRNEINDDWKKILVNLDNTKQTTTVLTNRSTEKFDGTTLTAQVAKDFFSQYLLAKQGGKTLTADDINKITNNVTSNSQYSKVNGPVYIASNLHIISGENTEIIKKYRDNINQILKLRSMQVNSNPTTLTKSTTTDKKGSVTSFDNAILAGKGMISDLLNVEVPESAIKVHLILLNTSSNILSTLESIRLSFSDPVRALAGVGQYNAQILEFQSALAGINKYFVQKTGSSQ